MAFSEDQSTVEGTLPKFAKNKAELCRILDITRPTLDAWLDIPGHPRAMSDGRYVVVAWKEFASGRKINAAAEETAELKLERLRDDVARGKVELMKAAGELVPVEWSKQLFAHLAISVRNVIMGSELAEADKLGLIDQIEKINADDYIAQLRLQTADAVAGEPELNLQNGTEEGQAAA